MSGARRRGGRRRRRRRRSRRDAYRNVVASDSGSVGNWGPALEERVGTGRTAEVWPHVVHGSSRALPQPVALAGCCLDDRMVGPGSRCRAI